MEARRGFPRLWLGGFVALVACSAPAVMEDAPGVSQEAIVDGVTASAYPEAALVDMYQGGQLGAYCSGSVIAPRVVLTAGHCVTGEVGFQPDNWKVTAPYNGMQKAKATDATTYDWTVSLGAVSPNLHDLGLIFLDTPIQVLPSQCPVVEKTELADNSQIVNIGRIQNGKVSTTDLFVSKPVTVADGASQGYPFDYSANDVIQSGDSGGPDELLNASPHVIVSVNSGGGSGEVLARTDPTVIYQWIEMEIQTHGGGCDVAAMADGGGDDASPDAASDGAGKDAAALNTGTAGMAGTDAAAAQVTIEAGPVTVAGTDAGNPADTDGGAVVSEEAGGSNAEAPTGSLTYGAPTGACSCLVGAHAKPSDVASFGFAALATVIAQRRKARRVARGHRGIA
jgi:hypothetical protein